jgi:hypothetical protein
MPTLIARLLLDAEAALANAADAIPRSAREGTTPGLNPPAWTIAHAAFFLDVWLSCDAQGNDMGMMDPWLRDWFERQKASPKALVTSAYDDARAALERAIERTKPFVAGLGEADLQVVPEGLEDAGWPPDITVGYFLSRNVAHLFAHAAELNHVAVINGAADTGLPGPLANVRGR